MTAQEDELRHLLHEFYVTNDPVDVYIAKLFLNFIKHGWTAPR